MKPSRETDALVVGGGPVGMFGALALAERDLRVDILDKDWSGSAHSYALALHPASLELLDRASLAQRLIDAGHRIERIAVYADHERLGELALNRLGSRFPFVLVLPQSALELALESLLHEYKVRVLWNHELLSLEPGAEEVSAEIGRVDKVSQGYPIARTEWVIEKRFTTRAGFVIGADGYHSFTRKSLGARYEDFGGAQYFAVFEFQSPVDLGDEVRLVLHENTTNVLWPIRGGRGRWSFQIDSTGRPLTVDTLASLITERAPWFDPPPTDVYWTTSTCFERRLADRFGRGRVWLAGDAAHITGPAGVQSMNIGLREAADLADRIERIVRKGEPMSTLEEYDRERRAEWSSLLQQPSALQVADEAPDWAREQAARLLPCVPASGSDLHSLLGQIGLSLG